MAKKKQPKSPKVSEQQIKSLLDDPLMASDTLEQYFELENDTSFNVSYHLKDDVQVVEEKTTTERGVWEETKSKMFYGIVDMANNVARMMRNRKYEKVKEVYHSGNFHGFAFPQNN